MVYSEKPFPDGIARCKLCDDFIATGKLDLKDKLLKILSQTQINTPVSEFKLICKYLLFCSPAKPLPIGINQLRNLEDAMDKQGSLENIKVWCFPTPDQRQVLHQNKVLFLASWGTGKTLLMTAKAIELAESGQKVLFLVLQLEKHLNAKGETLPSLLCLQLKLKLEKYFNITVKSFTKEDITKLSRIGKGYNHVFIDEFFGDPPHYHLKEEQYFALIGFIKSKQTLWLSMSGNTSGDESIYDDTSVKQLVMQWFPNCGFKTVTLRVPLRTPKKVIDHVKKFYISNGRHRKGLNQHLLTSSELPPNLTEGKITKFKLDKIGSLTECIKQCLAVIPKGKFSMIIMNGIFVSGSRCKDCKPRVLAELFNSAFIQLGEKPPLHYTYEYRSPMMDIENWLTKGSDRHLVVSTNFALGFEHSIVINLSGVSSSSRSSGQLIIPSPIPSFPNFTYLALPIADYCEQGDHDCDNIFLAGLDTPLNTIG